MGCRDGDDCEQPSTPSHHGLVKTAPLATAAERWRKPRKPKTKRKPLAAVAFCDEGIELGLHGGDALELHVQRGFQFEQQFFVAVEAFDDRFDHGLDDGRDDWLDRLKNRLRLETNL